MNAGEKDSRQEAKAHTFAPPLWSNRVWEGHLLRLHIINTSRKYKGVTLWHSKLAKEALETNMITTPSGRQFSFPDVERRSNGSVSYFTQIKNYPVQSFATADIVPLVLMEKLIKHLTGIIHVW